LRAEIASRHCEQRLRAEILQSESILRAEIIQRLRAEIIPSVVSEMGLCPMCVPCVCVQHLLVNLGVDAFNLKHTHTHVYTNTDTCMHTNTPL
jgi:hypothetical protein